MNMFANSEGMYHKAENILYLGRRSNLSVLCKITDRLQSKKFELLDTQTVDLKNSR